MSVADIESLAKSPNAPSVAAVGDSDAPANAVSDERLRELGYKAEFRREMSLFGVLGISFCAIGILTGMSSAFQTGLFSGGPLGLFWGWNVRTSLMLRQFGGVDVRGSREVYRSAACSCCSSRFAWLRYAAPSMSFRTLMERFSDDSVQSDDGRSVLLGVQDEARRAVPRL